MLSSASNHRTTRFRLPMRSLGIYSALVLFFLVVILPFYWVFKSAISTPEQLFTIPPTYFPRLSWENFGLLAEQVPFYRYLVNSIMFSISTALFSVAISFVAAYGFARIRVPGSGALLWAFVLSMALPEIVTIIPLYQILRGLRLVDTIAGLTLVMGSVLTPFTVWVLVSFIQQVPVEIEEAAIIDGASLLQIFWKILVPLTAPALATMVVINFINAWNNLLYPLAFAGPDSKTLSVAITEIFQYRAAWGRPWNLISTLGVTMVVPVTILVFVSQRAIVRGLTRGAIK